MGAPELLHHLRSAGLVLTLTPAGGLHVAPRDALTDDHRSAIRVERDALVLALEAESASRRPPPPRRSGNPLMTPEQGDDCHAGGWDDAEIDAYMARQARFTRMGRMADADHLAERLTLRDRDGDDRRVCLECANYLRGRCLKPKAAGVGAELGRLAHTLQRCVAFNVVTGPAS